MLMFVKLIFEDFEHFENRKRVTLTRPAIAGQLQTAIMKADGFTCTAPSHERSRSGFILEIIDGRELPEYMTMNKGKICG